MANSNGTRAEDYPFTEGAQARMREWDQRCEGARKRLAALGPGADDDQTGEAAGDTGAHDPRPGAVAPGEQRKPECASRRPAQRTSAKAWKGRLPDADDPLLGFAPVPHSRPRSNSITADKQRAFIAALAATGIVREAALAIGKSLEALYKLRDRPGAEGFRAAWDEAVDRGVVRLESCALARAIEGEERMVVSGGKLLGFETRHNDTLTMFFLRQRRPERYGSAGKFEDLRAGHPVYERLKAEWEAEKKREDPQQVARLYASIDAKVFQFRRTLELRWEEERRALIAENGGVVPRIDTTGAVKEVFRDDDDGDQPDRAEGWGEKGSRAPG